MPWCPQCKTEYEDGVKECVDCKIQLTDEMEECVEWSPLVVKESEDLTKLDEFLKYSNIQTSVETNEEGLFSLNVPEKQMKEAKKLFLVYKRSVEAEKIQKKLEEAPEEMEEDVEGPTGNVYLEELDKVEEVKSSASAFLFVGILGFVVLTACALNIIELNMEGFNKYMFFTVMYSIMIAFIIIGVQSALKVGSMKKSAIVAKNREDEIKEWFLNKYNAAYIEEGIEVMDETEKFFPRAEKIKSILLEKESTLSIDQVEKYTEEIYEKLFG